MSNSNIVIREAVTGDAENIAYISTTALGYECESSLVKMRLDNLDKARERVYVAEADGQVIGFIQLEKYQLLYQLDMVNVLGLAVRKDKQGTGAGRLLMEAAEEWARESALSTVRLNSASNRNKAHEFYEHLGYQNTKEQKRFIKKL